MIGKKKNLEKKSQRATRYRWEGAVQWAWKIEIFQRRLVHWIPLHSEIFTQFIIATSRPLMILTVEILTSAYPNNPKIILDYFHREIIKIQDWVIYSRVGCWLNTVEGPEVAFWWYIPSHEKKSSSRKNPHSQKSRG